MSLGVPRNPSLLTAFSSWTVRCLISSSAAQAKKARVRGFILMPLACILAAMTLIFLCCTCSLWTLRSSHSFSLRMLQKARAVTMVS